MTDITTNAGYAQAIAAADMRSRTEAARIAAADGGPNPYQPTRPQPATPATADGTDRRTHPSKDAIATAHAAAAMDTGLTPTARMLAVALIWTRWNGGTLPIRETRRIAREIGMSRRSYEYAMKALEEKRHIEAIDRHTIVFPILEMTLAPEHRKGRIAKTGDPRTLPWFNTAMPNQKRVLLKATGHAQILAQCANSCARKLGN